MARLAHPNVIAVHDVGEVGARVFVAMEYVDGVVLGTWLKGHEGTPPPLRAILEVFRAAGRGLVAAHEAGLVHRDFKPENVMIGNDSRVRVLDFGLARAAGAAPERALDEDELLTTASITRSELRANLTVTGSIMGTPAYMAPEQYLGAVADAQSDQFSFNGSTFS